MLNTDLSYYCLSAFTMVRAKDFAARLLDLSLIYLTIDNLSLGNPKKLNMCYDYKEEEIALPPQKCLRHL